MWTSSPSGSSAPTMSITSWCSALYASMGSSARIVYPYMAVPLSYRSRLRLRRRVDDVEQISNLRLSGDLHPGLLDHLTGDLHEGVHVFLGVPYVDNMENVADQPGRVAAPAGRVPGSVLVEACP